MEKSKRIKDEARPRHYYKFPKKVFLGVSIAIIILCFMSMVSIWYKSGGEAGKNVSTFFNGILSCAILVWVALGAVQPERKNRLIATMFGLLFVLFIAGVITFLATTNHPRNAKIVITLAECIAIVLSIFATIAPHVRVSRPTPSSKDVTKEFTNSGKTTARYEKEAADATSSIIHIG